MSHLWDAKHKWVKIYIHVEMIRNNYKTNGIDDPTTEELQQSYSLGMTSRKKKKKKTLVRGGGVEAGAKKEYFFVNCLFYPYYLYTI